MSDARKLAEWGAERIMATSPFEELFRRERERPPVTIHMLGETPTLTMSGGGRKWSEMTVEEQVAQTVREVVADREERRRWFTVAVRTDGGMHLIDPRRLRRWT